MTDDFFNTKRKMLEEDLVFAALDLSQHTGSAAYKVKIPNTSPPLYIVVGAEEDIKKLMDH
jgi:hypothetical protein